MLNLIWLFLRIGATSFGGPAAHIAMMEEEFVHRRQWLSREKFLDLIAITNLIPGPNSTELAIHIGHHRAGWWGFWLAGICFILPAFVIVTAIAHFYIQYASLPQIQHSLLGVKVVVLAIIAQAFDRFLKSVFGAQSSMDFFRSPFWNNKTHTLKVFILVASLYLSTRGISEISILFTCGLIALFVANRTQTGPSTKELASVFLVFFKVGSVLFGSGYVLIAFLQTELIEKRHWVTESQLLDAISVGQFTPGPVFTTASFLGYLLQGFPGAIAATLGIFIPAFLFVGLSIPLYQKMNSSIQLRHILDGVVVGSLGLLLVTLWTLGRSLLTSPSAMILFTASLIILWRTRIPSIALILAGGFLPIFF